MQITVRYSKFLNSRLGKNKFLLSIKCSFVSHEEKCMFVIHSSNLFLYAAIITRRSFARSLSVRILLKVTVLKMRNNKVGYTVG